MELKEFIEKSIIEITSAIHNSSKSMINTGIGNGIPDDKEIMVSFDIAVTVGDRSENEGNTKISVLNTFGIGGSLKSEKDKHEVNRLSFNVPIKIKTLNYPSYPLLK